MYQPISLLYGKNSNFNRLDIENHQPFHHNSTCIVITCFQSNQTNHFDFNGMFNKLNFRENDTLLNKGIFRKAKEIYGWIITIDLTHDVPLFQANGTMLTVQIRKGLSVKSPSPPPRRPRPLPVSTASVPRDSQAMAINASGCSLNRPRGTMPVTSAGAWVRTNTTWPASTVL